MEIHLEALIECVDGDAGRLAGLIVERDTKKLTGIVVTRRGIVPEDIVVPLKVVRNVEPSRVYLRLTSRELSEEYHRVTESEYVPVGDDWELPPPGSSEEAVVTSIPSIGSEPPLAPIQSDLGRPFLLRELSNIPENMVEVDKQTQALCPEGAVGTLEELLFDPTTSKTTHFVVRLQSAPHLLVAVPEYLVGSVEKEAITLKAHRSFIESLPASPQIGIS